MKTKTKCSCGRPATVAGLCDQCWLNSQTDCPRCHYGVVQTHGMCNDCWAKQSR